MKFSMTKIQHAWIMFIMSLVILAVVSIEVIGEIELWFVGVEKQAHIINLNHTSWTKYSGQMYHYDLEIDGTNQRLSTSSQLPIGSAVSVLAHPFKPQKYIVGYRNENLLDYLIGLHGADGLWRTIIELCGIVLLVCSPFVLLFHLLTLIKMDRLTST